MELLTHYTTPDNDKDRQCECDRGIIYDLIMIMSFSVVFNVDVINCLIQHQTTFRDYC